MWQYIYTRLQKKSFSPAAKQYTKKYAYPLFVAVHDGNVPVFKELVEYDQKSVQAVNNIKTPILCEVFGRRNLEMAEILLENGANPDPMYPFTKTPHLLVVEAVAVAHKGFIELLIKHGAAVDEEVNGFSVRKILDLPEQYVKPLFDGSEHCAGAFNFLKKAPEMKQLVEQLSPRPPMLETLAPAPPSDVNMAQLRQRSLPIPLAPVDDQPSSSGTGPNSYP